MMVYLSNVRTTLEAKLFSDSSPKMVDQKQKVINFWKWNELYVFIQYGFYLPAESCLKSSTFQWLKSDF